jgi:hypothetical protein
MAQGFRIKVKDKATKIIDGTVAADSVVVRNAGSESIDLGGSDVASGKGFALAKEKESPPMPLGSSLFGVAASGKEVSVEVLAV